MARRRVFHKIGTVRLRSRARDTHVAGHEVLVPPRRVLADLPAKRANIETVLRSRREIEAILDRKDRRLFVILGPCSIHDPKAAWEYALRLRRLAGIVQETLLLVMRVYFEKPRTTVGWKGLINDPDLDGTFRIQKGIRLARSLLLRFTELGLPTANEILDPVIPQYLMDLVCWAAIGARTSESQVHRELASGLSAPVGFKNATDGNLAAAVNGARVARSPHHFLGVDPSGRVTVYRTTGNPYAHVVLRGGNGRPNFDPRSVRECERLMEAAKVPPNIVVDCSHGNSNKDYRRQPEVFRAVLRQVERGSRSLVGLMLESHLCGGNQPLPRNPKGLKYGVSITDPCLGWEETEELVLEAHRRLRKLRRPRF